LYISETFIGRAQQLFLRHFPDANLFVVFLDPSLNQFSDALSLQSSRAFSNSSIAALILAISARGSIAPMCASVHNNQWRERRSSSAGRMGR
jgi:hypothetical protein